MEGEVPEVIASMKNKIVEMCQGLPLAASVLEASYATRKNMNGRKFVTKTPLLQVNIITGKIA